MRIAIVLFALLLLSSCSSNSPVAEEWRAADALIPRFETVFYAKGSLLSGSIPSGADFTSQSRRVLILPFGAVLSGLNSRGQGIANEILSNSSAVLVGAGDFRSPEGPLGLGPIRSRYCSIVVLKRQYTFDLGQRLGEAPSSSEGGIRIWSWSKQLLKSSENGSPVTQLNAAKVGPSYLLFCNELKDLRNIAPRLDSPGLQNLELNRTRDWKLISQHDLWGYRSYRHAGIPDRSAAGLQDVSAEAQNLILMVDFEKNTSLIRLYCEVGKEQTPARLNQRGLRFREREMGIWDMKLTLRDDEESFERIFHVMSLFGFGINI